MPDEADSAQSEADSSPRLEVLETDSGRKPIWGIVAVVGFLGFAVFAVWRVNAGDSNASPSYSSSVPVTTVVSEGNSATGITGATAPRNSTAARVFFFALVGAMALVGARIIWRARKIYRATARRASKSPGASLN